MCVCVCARVYTDRVEVEVKSEIGRSKTSGDGFIFYAKLSF